MSRLRFDHLVHWVPDLTAGIAAYEANGLHVAPGGQHPGWGTHNALSHFGLAYIEIVAFHDLTQMENPTAIFANGPAGVRAGGRAGNFAIAVPDLEAVRTRLAGQQITLNPPALGERMRPDGVLLRWQTATLHDGPPWRPFFIQWGVTDAARLADLRDCGVDQPHPGGFAHLTELEITTREPKEKAAWLGTLLATKPRATESGWHIPLARCDLRLVKGEQEMIESLTLHGGAAAQCRIYGLNVQTSVSPT